MIRKFTRQIQRERTEKKRIAWRRLGFFGKIQRKLWNLADNWWHRRTLKASAKLVSEIEWRMQLARWNRKQKRRFWRDFYRSPGSVFSLLQQLN
jgi:hypothetical protein